MAPLSNGSTLESAPAKIETREKSGARCSSCALRAARCKLWLSPLVGNPGAGTWNGLGVTDNLGGTFDPHLAGPGNHEITFAFFNADTMITAVTHIEVF